MSDTPTGAPHAVVIRASMAGLVAELEVVEPDDPVDAVLPTAHECIVRRFERPCR